MNHRSWVSDFKALEPQPTEPIVSWLTKPRIISEALKRHYATFEVKVISQVFTTAYVDEYEVLGIKTKSPVLVRQVILEADNIPRTLGRVIIPMTTYENNIKKFENLENKPIGETLLYHNPDVTRGPFSYAFIAKNDPLNSQAISEGLWARRSVFKLKEDALLVTELFLPTLGHYEPVSLS